MIRKTMLSLFAVLAIGITFTMPAYGTPIGTVIGPYEFWPKYEFSVPSVVTVGEEFVINVNYQYFVTDVNEMYIGPFGIIVDRMSQAFYDHAFEQGEFLIIFFPPFVEIIDDDVILTRNERIDTTYDSPIVFSSGIYQNLEFNNTKNLSLQIPMTINEPTTQYPGGTIAFNWATNQGPVFNFIVQGDRVIIAEADPCHHPLRGESRICHDLPPIPGLAGGLSDEIMQHKPVYIGDVLNATGDLTIADLDDRSNQPQRDPPLLEFGQFLLDYYPDENHWELIKDLNLTSEFVDELFRTFPDLTKKSIDSTSNFSPGAYTKSPLAQWRAGIPLEQIY